MAALLIPSSSHLVMFCGEGEELLLFLLKKSRGPVIGFFTLHREQVSVVGAHLLSTETS